MHTCGDIANNLGARQSLTTVLVSVNEQPSSPLIASKNRDATARKKRRKLSVESVHGQMLRVSRVAEHPDLAL